MSSPDLLLQAMLAAQPNPTALAGVVDPTPTEGAPAPSRGQDSPAPAALTNLAGLQAMRQSMTNSWADEVIAAQDESAGTLLEAGTPSRDSLAEAIGHSRVDGLIAKAAITTDEVVRSVAGLGSTTIMRSFGGSRSTVRFGQDLVHTCCGVPYGPSARPLAWSDADLKGPAGSDDVEKIVKALTRLSDAGSSTAQLPSGHQCAMYQWPVQDLFIQGGAQYQGYWRALQVRAEIVILIYLTDNQHLVEVGTGVDLTLLRTQDRAVFNDVLTVLTGIHEMVVSARWNSNFLMLQDAALRDMTRGARRSAGASYADYSRYLGGGPLQIFDSLGTGIPTAALLDRRIPVTALCAGHRVAMGVMSAGDVPPSLVIGLGADGGKSLTGSVLTIRDMARGAFYTHTTSMTANAHLDFLKRASKEYPMLRDGLFSPACASALYGTGDGRVFANVNHTSVFIDTVLTTLTPDKAVVVTSRDPVHLLTYLADLVALQGWRADFSEGGGNITVLDSNGVRGHIEVRYGQGLGPRWGDVLAGADIPDLCGSDLLLDYGCSGLGRFILGRYIIRGKFVGVRNLAINTKGHFAAAAAQVRRDKAMVQGTIRMPVSYVVDAEFIARKGRDGTQERYVYAIGVAKFGADGPLGSCGVVENSPHLDRFLTANARVAAQHTGNLRALQSTLPQGDPVAILNRLVEIAKLPHVRIYAKGNTAEGELLTSTLDGATRLFRRQAGAKSVVREIGHLVHRYEDYAHQMAIEPIHNPAAEALLFGAAAGFGLLTPAHLATIGMTPADALLSEEGVLQI